VNLRRFALSSLLSHWRIGLFAIALLALAIQTFRLSATQGALQAETAGRRADAASYAQAQAEATNMALTQRVRDESEYQEKADAVDATIDDLRGRLRAALVRPKAAASSAGRADCAPESGGPGLPQEMSTTATGDSGSVQVSADIMAGLAAYAIKAHEWAETLDD
jgi:hypothetical protein